MKRHPPRNSPPRTPTRTRAGRVAAFGLAIAVACTAGCLAGTDAARASEADCTAILDAMVKMATTPVRQKVSIKMPGTRPPLQTESIRIGDTMYMQARGQWFTQPYDGQKIAANARQALDAAPHTCSREGSEPVNGQPADIYRMENAASGSKSESRIWISPTSGLPLRQHTILLEGANANGEHEARYDYTNVTPPPGVKK